MSREGSAACGDARVSQSEQIVKGSDPTFDRAYTFLPEDLCVLERQNSAGKDCLEEQTLDVI